MEDKWIYFIAGVIVGWLIKVPFLIKYYRELKATRNYQEMKRKERIEHIQKTIDLMDRVRNMKSYNDEQDQV